MAYLSDESGNVEVYVQPYPGPGGKWQVSTAGGSNPKWRSDGKELFYNGPDGTIMAVEVTTVPIFHAGVPEALFAVRIKGSPGPQWDVSPDGQRFLINVPVGQETAEPVTLVQNWTAGRGR